MKVTELSRGQMFKFGKQKNYRRFLETFEVDGELWLMYDNCKQMKVSSDLEVEVLKRFPVKGYGSYYSTGEEMFDVQINGKKTKISYFLKDDKRLLYVYSIMNPDGEFVHLDIRDIPDYPNYNKDELMHCGIRLLKEHMVSNPNLYERFF